MSTETSRRGFIASLMAGAASLFALPMLPARKYVGLVTIEKDFLRVRDVFLNGERVSNTAVAANDREGWVDVYPHYYDDAGRLCLTLAGVKSFTAWKGLEPTKDELVAVLDDVSWHRLTLDQLKMIHAVVTAKQ